MRREAGNHENFFIAKNRDSESAKRFHDMIERTSANEVMVTANIFDHGKRKRSFEIIAEVHPRSSGDR